MAIVEYNCTDDPTEIGVYACRVTDPVWPDRLHDVFLVWHDSEWTFPGSTGNKFRRTVHGWIGPLRHGFPKDAA